MTQIEYEHQVALIGWARRLAATYDELACLNWLYAIPMGESRGDTPESRKRAGGKVKSMGGIAGVPDLCLPVARAGFHHLYIEMKAPGEKPKSHQVKCHDFLRSEGSSVVVCETWFAAAEVILDYLGIDKKDIYVSW